MEALQDYILSKLTVSINKISLENWDEDFLRKEKQLLFLCPDSGESCPERTTQLKLAAALVQSYLLHKNNIIIILIILKNTNKLLLKLWLLIVII